VSTKYGSLALDDARDLDGSAQMDSDFEPQLQVIVNAHYVNASGQSHAPQGAVEVVGSITVSF